MMALTVVFWCWVSQASAVARGTVRGLLLNGKSFFHLSFLKKNEYLVSNLAGVITSVRSTNSPDLV